jgi:hypothetical protein
MLSGIPEERSILFIFGCQRSGTTMLSRIFEGDANVSPFAEHDSRLSRHDHDYRIRDLGLVSEAFDKTRGRLIVAKPLVESQRSLDILDFFTGAKALWMYRDYKDVVRSYVKAFDRAGINIIRNIVEQRDHWASERIADSNREVVREFFSEQMRPSDAAALFWWIRNGWFFDLGLDRHPRVRVCNYGTLVSSPDSMMRRIYDFTDVPYPGSHLVNGVHVSSRGLGNNIVLDPAIDALCRERLARLEESCRVSTQDTWSHD